MDPFPAPHPATPHDGAGQGGVGSGHGPCPLAPGAMWGLVVVGWWGRGGGEGRWWPNLSPMCCFRSEVIGSWAPFRPFPRRVLHFDLQVLQSVAHCWVLACDGVEVPVHQLQQVPQSSAQAGRHGAYAEGPGDGQRALWACLCHANEHAA